ncbi:MAG: cysteine--tRNA ligase [Candidatus Levybacteria bacterium RIFCSPHIGHO2_01_FULL_38_26]|nr:MAG: cysteine--tRNA ligase [Candidatus Levybacteria bacterium RIFCSPHIGHO2_01_FULL_38_26]
MLRLYNSLSKSKEKFVPLEDKKVKMYVCGITPYDTTHLGHAFTYVFFDTLVRYFKFRGFDVKYTQNVTDIDDDILKRAKEEGRDWRELGNFWTGVFLKDMKMLNVLPPTNYVKATNAIDTMIGIIETLIHKKTAYENNGNVYFDIDKFKKYGKLSHFNTRQMLILSKERGGNPADPLKKNPLDFLLWQKSSPDEPAWDSPFGKGRPGWHIECSSMIKDTLGRQIDIHGGGRDLIFPHHESEIAQSETFTGKIPFVKYWMHTAMVLYEGEKMAKSLGNLIMVSDLLKKYNPNDIRCFLLTHHYRKPWEFDEEELKYTTGQLSSIKKLTNMSDKTATIDSSCVEEFTSIMDDDLDTPNALNFLVEIAKKPKMSSTLLKLLSILGIRI